MSGSSALEFAEVSRARLSRRDVGSKNTFEIQLALSCSRRGTRAGKPADGRGRRRRTLKSIGGGHDSALNLRGKRTGR